MDLTEVGDDGNSDEDGGIECGWALHILKKQNNQNLVLN